MTEQPTLRVTRNFSQFFEHLKSLGFKPSICLDVGAAAGTPSLYEAFPKAYHIAFEPLPEFHEPLRKSLENYRSSIRKCALSDREGGGRLLRHKDLFGSSIMHNRDAGSDNVVPIRLATLDHELRNDRLEGRILLKTDCQGADLLVMKGGKKTLEKVEVVILEASFFRFWGNHQPIFHEIIEHMIGLGFVVYDLLDGLFRPRDNALGQIDIVFVKVNSPLRSSQYW